MVPYREVAEVNIPGLGGWLVGVRRRKGAGKGSQKTPDAPSTAQVTSATEHSWSYKEEAVLKPRPHTHCKV